jgi:phospholipase C
MAERKPPEDAPSRRGFLKLSAAAATGAVAPLAGTPAMAAETPPLRPVPGRPGFEHLVVLMFENRSFDNLLGYLYPPGKLPEGQTFDGAANGTYVNPSPGGNVASHIYEGATDWIMRSPTPDPGEEYPHVNTQLFATVDPPGNAHVNFKEMSAPFNAPPAGAAADLSGFVTD